METISHPDDFSYFDLRIRNLGLPFPEMSVGLGFYSDEYGWLSCPLHAIDIRTGDIMETTRNVATGLVVEFGLRSFDMDSVRYLSALKDLRKQRAGLSVYCGGYVVKSIRLESPKERILIYWHNIFDGIWRRLGLGSYAKKRNSWLRHIRLPVMQILSAELMSYLAISSGRKVEASQV